MHEDPAANIERAVLATLPTAHLPTEEEIYSRATALRQLFSVSDETFALIIRSLHAKLAITMNMGTALSDEAAFVPWLSARKASIDPFYWDRLLISLSRLTWPPLVVNTMDRITDEILDLSGDPNREHDWKRRGLVVGDVQSGKTATYTALCCKAADAGFRFIVLLTGTLESLRRQTQERLDEGFVGLDSSEVLQAGIRNSRLVGVGHIDSRRTAGVFTSRSRDFNKNLLNQLGFRLAAFQEPVLVVLKKNKRVLENLENWLRSYNASPDGKIDTPMLLIDDEADSASINTNAISADPTAINAQIRKLLGLFNRSSYVGFTATPFANVFIDPDTDDAMFDDDLFPRDYIYSLEAPNNYVGPRAFFEDPNSGLLRVIDDAEITFPRSLKSTSSVTSLPQSLIDALHSFILATAIRDIRSEGVTHRSMLVNVSRFTNIQNQVAALLDAELRNAQRQIRAYSRLPPDEALANSDTLSALHRLWRWEYSEQVPSWQDLQLALNDASQPIVVKAVNQVAGGIDYKSHASTGLRVVAVGGNSLSRGLTLEGLSTSYFYRNSQMYDTLMQMGRWFGYRDNYRDLCRLWITEEARDWYAHIMEATDELRAEFKRMKAAHLTPRDFGLKVRAHPDALIVTARNKMRTAETIIRNVSLSGQGLEAARLRANPNVLAANLSAMTSFAIAIDKSFTRADEQRAAYFWRRVPATLVADLLQSFQSHPLNFDFQVDVISAFLRRTREATLQEWDVAIPGGSEDETKIAGDLVLKPLKRILKVSNDGQTIMVSGTKLRVGSGGIERIGLTADQAKAAVDRATTSVPTRAVTDRDYRIVRDHPLLLLYFLRGYTRSVISGTDERYPNDNGNLIASLGLSFPLFDDSAIADRVEYRVNVVEWRSMFESETDDDDSVDDNLE
jgi:Z1 domain